MALVILLISLAVVIATYVIFSIHEKSFVNVLTPFLFFGLPALYVFELLYLVIFGQSASDYAYFLSYTAYALGVVAKAIGYVATPAQPLPLLLKLPKIRVAGAPYLLLLIGTLLYAPVLIEYRSIITSPREIYAATRTGYGIQFYLSSFAVYLALILFVFSGIRSRLSVTVFSTLSLLLLYMHGSKGHVLLFILIALYFLVFVKGMRFGLKRMLVAGSAISVGIVALFYVTFSQDLRDDFLESLVGYSDYTRNTMLIMDDPHFTPQLGRLTLEDSFYALIPRALFPDKRKDFGSLWLAARYFPERFELDTGAPAFGFGVLYADFGPVSLIFNAIAGLFAGAVMKLLVARLRTRPDAGSFLVLLVFLDVTLIPAGSAPLIVYYVFALAIKTISSDQPLVVAERQPRPHVSVGLR